jgi:hypothetical protein
MKSWTILTFTSNLKTNILDSPGHPSFKKIHIKPSPCCIELGIKHYPCRLKVITLFRYFCVSFLQTYSSGGTSTWGYLPLKVLQKGTICKICTARFVNSQLHYAMPILTLENEHNSVKSLINPIGRTKVRTIRL